MGGVVIFDSICIVCVLCVLCVLGVVMYLYAQRL